jgi:hypothetical protein
LGPLEVKTPRDREGSFAPQILPKRATRLAGPDKVLGLYAGGMTVGDIPGHLSELYGTKVDPDTISRITEEDVPFPIPLFRDDDQLVRRLALDALVRVGGATAEAALNDNADDNA